MIYREDSEREFNIDVVALEVLRRAAEDFATVSDGWARFPDLLEENWERVGSRVFDMIAELAQAREIPDPMDQNSVPDGFWNELQWVAQQKLGGPW